MCSDAATSTIDEGLAKLAVMRDRFLRSLVLPNYTPGVGADGWCWECDVFELTGTGLFIEHEIKLSVSDFKRDTQKRHWRGGETKHQRLERGDARGPSRFYFVTPVGMLALEHHPLLDSRPVLPRWAGLIELEEVDSMLLPVPEIRKRAPLLHRARFKGSTESCHRTAYYRMYKALLRLRERSEELRRMREQIRGES